MAGAEQAAGPWWRRVASGLRARRERRAAAYTLYGSVVRQARAPFFYAELGVPDTREGRLEMLMLHAILVMRRLQAEGVPGRALAQELFGLMFAELDQQMREWGVGDLSVGKQIRRVAQTFYARAAAAEPALAEADLGPLVSVLTRNVYGAEPADADAVRRLAAYLVAQALWLRGQPVDLVEGRISFRPISPAGDSSSDNRLQPHAD